MNELTKYNGGDGFGGFTSETEGDDFQQHSGFIRGAKLKFTNTCVWQPPEYAHPKRLIAYRLLKVVQYWGPDRRPVAEKTVIVPFDKRFPDVDAWNDNLDRSEWVDGPVAGGPKVGPYQRQLFLYLVDPETYGELTYATNDTVGGNIAISELNDKISWARGSMGPNVCPVISCGDIFMPTRWGGRQRPHFLIHEYRDIRRQATMEVAALEDKPAVMAIEAPSIAPDPVNGALESFGRKVSPPPMRQEMKDDIPY
jgi:hypothetical protein